MHSCCCRPSSLSRTEPARAVAAPSSVVALRGVTSAGGGGGTIMRTKLLLLVFGSSWCTAAVKAACADDEGCELNGKCLGGACRCDPQWSGPSCGQLRLGPTTRDSGYRGGGAGALARASSAAESTWGGSLAGPDSSGRWHGYFARMSLGCGLLSWKTNSQIVHAVSSSGPLGPYAPREPAMIPRFAHNPTVHRDSKTGRVYVYHIGCGANSTAPRMDCTNGTTPAEVFAAVSAEQPSPCDGPHWMGGVSAPSFDGPWRALPAEITLRSPHKADHWLTNPAPCRMPNGTVLWLYRQNAGSWPHDNATSERLGVATSTGWAATALSDLTPTRPIFDFPLEDAYVWRDARGFYHALTHKGRPGDSGGEVQREVGARGQAESQGRVKAGHLFSRDGLRWSIGSDPPYNSTITFMDGTVMQTGKRARPQLVVSSEGNPLLLTTGAELAGDHDFVFTTVQPILQK
eukprot:COSAG01_NODE_6883_length_3452_cov_6.226663_1_plen_460_part_00